MHSQFDGEIAARRARVRGARCEPLEARTLLSATLAKDVNEVGGPPFGNIDGVRVGDSVYFVSRRLDTGRELWKTDGTVAGTSIVKDILPGPLSADPQSPVTYGGLLYFTADDGVHGRSLWKTDGTEGGTVLVDDVVPGPQGAMMYRFGVAGGKLIFIGPGADLNNPNDAAIWSTDGTAAGTAVLRAGLVHGTTFGSAEIEFPSQPYGATIGDTFVFMTRRSSGRNDLWKSDGTAAGTGLVKDLYPGASDETSRYFTAAGGKAYFIASPGGGQETLWVTDGTAAGTTPLLNSPMFIQGLTDFGGTLYFTAPDPASASNQALWKTDGTPEGTRIVYSGADAPGVGDVGVAAGKLYFTGGYADLWVSDGTTEASHLVRHFGGGGATPSIPGGVIDVDGIAVFTAGDTPGDESVWVTDGTPGGTRRIADVNPDNNSSFINGRWATGAGKAVFVANDPIGYGMWSVDPAAAAPQALLLARMGSTQGSRATSVVPVRGDGQHPTVVFAADDGIIRAGPYVSDGTPAGTSLLKPFPFQELPTIVPVPGGRALLYPNNGEMWGTDGTAAGTVKFPSRQVIVHGAEYAGLLYFSTSDGRSLWKTDGTPAGTSLVKTFVSPNSIQNLRSDGEHLYVVTASVGRSTIWTTDGTDAGTVQGPALTQGAEVVDMAAAAPGQMYFVLRLSNRVTHELWKTDGTAAGTARVKSFGDGAPPALLTPYKGALHFDGSDLVYGHELWRTDGTTAGTVRVTDTQDGPVDFAFFGMVVRGDAMYFERAGGLYRSDGTAAGTARLVSSTGETYTPSSPGRANRLVLAGDTLYFTATSNGEGVPAGEELWQTDPSGTRVFRVADINPGRGDSAPSSFAAAGDTLFFAATEPEHGQELWRARAADTPVVMARNLFYDGSAFDVPAGTVGPAVADSKALALDKQPLLPGGVMRPANVSNYAKGINGVFIDFLGAPRATLTADDFDFRAGIGGDPAGWAAAPAPAAVTLLPGWEGTGSARYEITWPENAIRNRWLQVTVKANADTGLAQPDVFTYGNLVAEIGDATTPLRVSALDLMRVRRVQNRRAAIDSPFDFNRDGVVNALDYGLVRANLGRSLSRPAPAPVPTAAAPVERFARVWDDGQPPLL